MMRYSDAEDGDDSYQMDIEPDDMDVSDTVAVVWEMSPCHRPQGSKCDMIYFG